MNIFINLAYNKFNLSFLRCINLDKYLKVSFIQLSLIFSL